MRSAERSTRRFRQDFVLSHVYAHTVQPFNHFDSARGTTRSLQLEEGTKFGMIYGKEIGEQMHFAPIGRHTELTSRNHANPEIDRLGSG